MAATSPDQPSASTAPEAASASPIDRHDSPVAETREKSGKATASLVLGVIGVLASIIPILAWILGGVALGLGITARNQIRTRGLSGMGIATAGMILGIIAIVAGIAFAAVNVAIMT